MKTATSLLLVTLVTAANSTATFAGTCGQVPCTNLTGSQTNAAIEKTMKAIGTDCSNVKSVEILNNSKPGFMMIYTIKCDDGAGVQSYQLTHWVTDREIIVDKHSGSFKAPVKIRY